MIKLRNNVRIRLAKQILLFSVFYEKRAMLVTMSHPPADRSMFYAIISLGLNYPLIINKANHGMELQELCEQR